MTDTIKSFPLPLHYEGRLSYSQQWSEYSKLDLEPPDVLALAYMGCDTLVGITSSSSSPSICTWKIPKREYGHESPEILHGSSRGPCQRIEAPARLYSIFVTAETVLVAGTGGVWMYKVDDGVIQQDSEQHFATHPAPKSTTVMQILIRGTDMFGIADDAFGVYRWDLVDRKIVQTYYHSNPTCISLLRERLLVGGSDGIVTCWNVKTSEKLKDVVVSKNKISVTCLTIIDEEEKWWVVGGEAESGGGFVSVWNEFSKTVAATVTSHSTPHVLFLHNRELLVGANEKTLTRFANPFMLDEVKTVCCDTLSIRAICGEGDRVAVTGAGGHVVVLENYLPTDKLIAL